MRALNVRLLAIIVGSGVVLAILVVGLNRFQVYRHANFFYQTAQRSKDSDDIEQRLEAVKNFQRYLGLNPEDNDVRAELGTLLLDIAKTGGPKLTTFYGDAFFCFESVLRNDQSRSDVRRKLVEVAMTTRRYSDAQEHLEELLEESPDDPELLTWMGQCQASSGKENEAKESFKKAIEKSPQTIDTYTGLAGLMRKDVLLRGDRDLHPMVEVPVDEQTPEVKTPEAKESDAQKEGGKEQKEAEKTAESQKIAEDKTPDATKPADGKKTAAPATVMKEDENHPDTWMNRLVAANPQSSQALLTRGQYLQATNKPDEARQDAVESLKYMPNAIKSLSDSLQKTSQALQTLAGALDSQPASLKQAVDGLEAASGQFSKVSQEAAVLAENKDCAEVEEAVANALNGTFNSLKSVSKALSDVAAENEKNEDVVGPSAAAAKTKAEAVKSYDSLAASLEGALILLAECETDKMEKEGARRYASRAMKFFPNSASGYSILSQIEIAEENNDAARDWIERGLDATGEDPGLLWKKANFLIDDLAQADLGDDKKKLLLERLDEVVDKLRVSPSYYRLPAFITFLTARAAFVQGQWANAAQLFAGIQTDLGRMSPRLAMQCDQMAAACYERLGRPELAREAADRARRTPGAVAGRFGEIAKMLAQGNFDAAVAEMDKMKEAGNLAADAWIILAQNNLGINRGREKSKQDWATFDKVLAQAKAASPDDPRLVAISAEALAAQEKIDEAIALLSEACRQNPKEVAQWQFLVRLAQQKEDWALAEKILAEAGEQLGDTVELRISRAVLLIDRDKKESAGELQKLSTGADQFSEADRARLWSVLAACARQIGDLDLAQSLCLKAAAADPTNLKLRVFLFEVAAMKKDDKAMAAAVEEIKIIEGEGPLWHYYEAVRLATLAESENEAANLKAALEQLAQSKILRPNWEQIPMLAGRIQLRKGDRQAAIESFSDAVAKGSRDPQGISALVSLLYEQGRNDEAQRYIKMLEDSNVELSTQTQRLQAQDKIMHGELTEGLDSFRKIAENSSDFRDHLRLGQVLSALCQQARIAKQEDREKALYEECEKSLRKAVELAPEEAAVWLTLVQFLSRSGKENEALEVVSEARKTVAKERLPLVLALCFQSLGRASEAEQQFLAAIAASDGKDHAARYLVDFYLRQNKIDDAEKIIDKMIDGSQKADEDDVAWARRRKAIILYTKSGLPNRRDAIALIDQNLQKDPESAEDMREKAKLLASFGNTKDRKEAAGLLEKLLSRPNPNPGDRFLMANILLAENNWPGVTAQMRQLLAMDEVQPVWLRFYVAALLDRGELADAASYLRRLERAEPNSQATTKFNAVLMTRRDDFDRIIPLVDDYVDNSRESITKDTTPKELENLKVVRSINAANILEEIIDSLPATESGSDPKKITAAKKLTEKAEQYWREISKVHPEGTLRLVRFLSKFGKRDEALDIAESTWQKGKPSSIATTVVSLIFAGEATPQQVQRVERIINDATITFGETNSLILAMAELRSIQRRYEEAEAMYRKVLEKEPRNVVALNNLAVFLALRNMKQDEALKMIDLAVEIAGPKPTLLDSRASVYLAKGEWQKALDDLDLALAGGQSSTRLFHQAQALEMGKKKEEAKQALKKAADLGLNENTLQPLERPVYRQLRDALK